MVLARFADASIMEVFAEKALETLQDYGRHDRLLLSPDQNVALWFIAWSGTAREVQSERYGEYLPMLAGTAYRLVEAGAELAGFLEVDAYLRGDVSPSAARDTLAVEVELSFLPGLLLKYPPGKTNPFPPWRS